MVYMKEQINVSSPFHEIVTNLCIFALGEFISVAGGDLCVFVDVHIHIQWTIPEPVYTFVHYSSLVTLQNKRE